MRCFLLSGAILTLLAVLRYGSIPIIAQEEPTVRPILNPANVPPWFGTGKFRSARWDGGPIEAEKGRLSGWPNYTSDDPRQVLAATRDWYNLRTIEYLKAAHINWAWVTWSTGFSPETEKEQWVLVSRYIDACHKNNIRVTAYFSIANIFWKDMFERLRASISWVEQLPHGGPVYYSRPNRYMATIDNPDWLKLQQGRVVAAVRAGADALWIDNTFSDHGREKVARFIDAMYAVASRVNPRIVVMSNYNQGIYTWGRLQNGVTTEDGQEPGYYEDVPKMPYLVTNAGLLRYNFAIGEGWRPVSVEYGGRHSGDRMTTSMRPGKWQLAIAECAMHHVSMEEFFEGLFLRDVYFQETQAIEAIQAMGVYNSFLERNEDYYTKPQPIARVGVLCDTTDAIVPYLDDVSKQNLNYDVIFNYQQPRQRILNFYRAILVPNTNPLSREWCAALEEWLKESGGTLVAVQDASLFSQAPAGPDQDFGLGPLLGISKLKIPEVVRETPYGRGRAIYLPKPMPAVEMAQLLRRHIGNSELVEVETPETVLSNIAFQPEHKRIVLHLLNYRQDEQRNLRVRVRQPVDKVEVLSPDDLSAREAAIIERKGSWEIVIPELRTYDLVAIYLGGDRDNMNVPN